MSIFNLIILSMIWMIATLLILTGLYMQDWIPQWLWIGFLFFYAAFGMYVSYLWGKRRD